MKLAESRVHNQLSSSTSVQLLKYYDTVIMKVHFVYIFVLNNFT